MAFQPEVQTNRRTISPGFIKSLFITVALIAVSQLLLLIPPPGVNPDALFHSETKTLFKVFGLPRFSIVTLGIMPYVFAYIFIEILSVVVVPFKSWRAQGTDGRKSLLRSARIATIFLAFMQGCSIAIGLENTLSLGAERMVPNPGWTFRFLFILSLTAGTFLLLWIADQITNKGLGHGISTLLFIGYAPSFIWNIFKLPSTFSKSLPFETFVLFTLVIFLVGLVIFIIIIMEKRHTKIGVKFIDGTEATFSLKMTTAGTIPLMFAASVAMLPLTFASFFDLSFITRFYSYGSLLYYLCNFIVMILLYFLFTAFFHNPDSIVSYLHKRKASVILNEKKSVSDFLDKQLELMAVCGAAYLTILGICSTIAGHYYHFSFGVTAIIALVAIGLDLSREARFRKEHNELSKVAEFHDLTEASLLQDVLERKEIPCVLRGYYHRALLYFFGPHIEVSALVPQHREAEAIEAMDFYELP